MNRFLIILLLVWTAIVPVPASAGSLSVSVMVMWDMPSNQKASDKVMTAFMDEIRSAVSEDTRFDLIEREGDALILNEWVNQLVLGSAPMKSGQLAGVDRYLFSAVDRSSSLWIFRFRIVDSRTGRQVRSMVIEAESLSTADRKSMTRMICQALAAAPESAVKTIAIGGIENASRYDYLNEPSERFRELLERSFSGRKELSILERQRTDQLVREMRLMELGGDVSRGYANHGEPGLFLLRGELSPVSPENGAPSQDIHLKMIMTDVDLGHSRIIWETQTRQEELAIVSKNFSDSFIQIIAERKHLATASKIDSLQHLSMAAQLAGEASLFKGADKYQPKFAMVFPRSSTIDRSTQGRKDLIEDAAREAHNAIFLDPDLYGAWFVLALCKAADEQHKHEAFDILSELAGRLDESNDLLRVTLWQIVWFSNDWVAAETALTRLSKMQLSDSEEREIIYRRLTWAVERRKNLELAKGVLLEAFPEVLRHWELDEYRRIIGLGNCIRLFLNPRSFPALSVVDLEQALHPYLQTGMAEMDVVAWYYIGEYYLVTKRLDPAVDAWKKSAAALERGVQEDVRNQFGLHHYGLESAARLVENLPKLNSTDEGVEIGRRFRDYPLERSMKPLPGAARYRNNASAHLLHHLAAIQESRGELEAALKLYEESYVRSELPHRLPTKERITAIRTRLGCYADFPLHERNLNHEGLPKLPVTAIASKGDRMWASVVTGLTKGIPSLFFKRINQVDTGGLFTSQSNRPWSRVSIPGMSDTVVVTTLTVVDDRLWVGTWGEGLAVYDMKSTKWTIINVRQGLPMDHILCLYPDGDKIWIGFGDMTRGGLGWIDSDDMQVHAYPSERRQTDPFSVAPSASITTITRWDQHLVVGEQLVGIKLCNMDTLSTQFSTILKDVGRPGEPFWLYHIRPSCLIRYHDNIWAGFYCADSSEGLNYNQGGLIRFDNPDTVARYFFKSGLPDDSISSLQQYRGRLVAGMAGEDATAGGLAVYDAASDRWIGLDGFNVLSLYSAGGKLYTGTHAGIRVFE